MPTAVYCQPQLEEVGVLGEQVDKLEARVLRLAAVICVHKALLRVSGFSLEHTCLPDGAAKESVLRAVMECAWGGGRTCARDVQNSRLRSWKVRLSGRLG